MKHSKFFLVGVLGSLMITLFAMSSCVKEPQKDNQVLEIYETYDANQFLPIMEAIDEGTIGMERQFGELLSGIGYSYGPEVGVAFYNDTAAVNAILNAETSKALLPEDVRFAWTAFTDSPRSGLYRLIALKTTNGKPAMYGDLLQDAQVEKDLYCAYPSILLTFNEQAAAQWAELTLSNVGRTLALVVEGKVYSYPTVRDQITCGKSQIVGPFEDEEAEELANKLMSKI